MADVPESGIDTNYKDVAAEVLAGIQEFLLKSDSAKAFSAQLADIVGQILAVAVAAMAPVGIGLAKGIAQSEDLVAPALADMAAAAASDMFGTDVPASAFQSRRNRDGRSSAAGALGNGFFNSIKGQGGPLAPGDEAAKKYLGMIINMALEGWYQGWFFEFMTSLVPQFDVGKIESFAELDDTIAQALGLGRLSRRVLSPLLDVTVVTPLRWQVNKQYRPELLSASAAIEAFRRGRFTQEQLSEELSRQGWSDERIALLVENTRPLLGAGAAIEAFQRGRFTGQQLTDELKAQGWDDERINVLVDNARRRLSVDDVLFLYYRGALSNVDAEQLIGGLGYDNVTIAALMRIADSRRKERFDLADVAAAVEAYIDRRIDLPALDGIINSSVAVQADQARTRLSAELRRTFTTRRLQADDVRSAVLDGILAPADYRRALERDGWEPLAVDVKELQLRLELDERRDLARAREQQAADRAAAQQLAAEEKAARLAEIADRRARAEFPSLAEYRRAYVHGRIDRDLYVAALTREHIVQDLDVILLDADADREAYLADLAARDVVVAKPLPAGLSIATLEAAVLNDILTLGEFDARLLQAGLADADRQLLVSLLQTKIAARDDARVKRAAAAQLAAAGGVSLDAYERAVRLGVRTRAQYDAYLAGIGTPDLSRALILELLDAQLAQDQAARTTREQRDAPAAAKGTSLAQRRRAVIAGVRSIETYEDALRAAGWPVDDQLVELDLLRAEIAAAADARARRDALATETPPRTLTLAQLEHAFTLGLIDATEFRDALRALRYGEADVALLVALATAQLEDIRAAQQQRAARAAADPQKVAGLAALEQAVRRGIATPTDYGRELAGRDYSDDAIALLVQLVTEEAALDLDGLRTRIAAALAKVDDAPALPEIEAAFAAGDLTVVDVQDLLLAFGIAHDAALVYARLLGTSAQE